MSKKQAGIILTLLALIVCTGILATRVNSQFKNGLDPLTTLSKKDDAAKTSNEENAANVEDFFYDSRNLREQEDAKAMENLKAIVEDENTAKDKKSEATNSLTEMTMARDNETRVELSVKSKGFEDAICFIKDNKARVVLKNEAELTENQCIEIQDIVMNVAKIYDITVECK